MDSWGPWCMCALCETCMDAGVAHNVMCPDVRPLLARIELGDASVKVMSDHALVHALPNLRIWCAVWLKPSNDAARAIAERRLREWLQRGDPRADATLDLGGEL